MVIYISEVLQLRLLLRFLARYLLLVVATMASTPCPRLQMTPYLKCFPNIHTQVCAYVKSYQASKDEVAYTVVLAMLC